MLSSNLLNSADDAKRQLKAMPRFSGGGNYGESSIEALLAGMGKPWRTQAVKVIVLLTDEPALHEQRSQTVGAQLEEKEIICFSATPDLPYFRHWAERSGGRWFKIGPHMDTGDLLELCVLLSGMWRRWQGMSMRWEGARYVATSL